MKCKILLLILILLGNSNFVAGQYFNTGVGVYVSPGYVGYEDHYRRSRVTGYDYQTKEEMVRDYFESRRLNREYRALERGRRVTMEDAIYYARMAAPKRLTQSEIEIRSGTLNWPKSLLSEEFYEYRKIISEAFIDRSIDGYLDMDEQDEVKNSVTEILTIWKSMIRDVSPHKYIRVKKFLESISYESRFST